MNDDAKRNVVREYLRLHHDSQFRQAVFALQLIYRPDHLAVLFDMAMRQQRAQAQQQVQQAALMNQAADT